MKTPAHFSPGILVFLLLLTTSLNSPAGQAVKIQETQVLSVLKSLDAALLTNDTKSAFTNFAPDAAITMILTDNGETTTNQYNLKQYRDILESGWSSFSDYRTERSQTKVQIAPDGRSATTKSTLLEKFRHAGVPQSCLTEENYTFELVENRILIKSMRNIARMQ